MPFKKSFAALVLATLLLTSLHQTHAATPRIAPIVSGIYLLGGSQNGKWIDAATTARQLTGSERYRVYTTAGQVGSGTATVSGSEDICADTQFVTLKPKPKAAEFVAFSGTTNPLPRKPRLHSINTAVYRQAVADILRAKGIANPAVRITKIVRIDLEGDGVDEVVLSATRANASLPSVNAGDYSLVVLRKVVNGKVQTIPLAEEYHLKSIEFAAPNTFTVPAIADFNGDGKMEIMLNWSYYEGSGAELYTVQGTKVTQVLSSGCGV
ncbi:MAG TPA: VCBS repeat-containing protein [Herpetosiphonaceae bacterium]